MSAKNPEDMLSAALRAHAGSAPRVYGSGGATAVPAPAGRPPRRRVAAGWVLLVALLLGLLGGGIAGWLSTL